MAVGEKTQREVGPIWPEEPVSNTFMPPPPSAGRRGRGRGGALDQHVDELARLGVAGEVDGQVAARAAAQQGGVGAAPPFDEHFLDVPTRAMFCSAAIRWTTSTSRSSRSCLTSSGT